MAVIPVKWNWEDALDKKQEQEYDDLLCSILHDLSDQIDRVNNRINRLEKRQRHTERQLRNVIKRNNSYKK